MVVACLVSAGVTFNNDVRRPSMDDWGSCGQAAGVATLGCACHSILPRMFERVFPTYHVLPNDVDLAEESEIARAKLQKKANKVKFCMWNVGRKESLIVFALNGLHIEHLMLRLDAIVSRRVNGLLDLFEGVDKHPIQTFSQTPHHGFVMSGGIDRFDQDNLWNRHAAEQITAAMLRSQC